MLTKQDVIKLWDHAQKDLKKRFPKYHKSISDYNLSFGRKRKSYGTCKYNTKTIEIHLYLCKHIGLKDVLDTIRHEMAHAIDKEVNGISSGHGKPWKKIASEIGAKPRSRSRAGNNVVKQSKYVMVLLKDNGEMEYLCGKHRKKRTVTLNKPIKNVWLRGRKSTTINKLMYISWNTFMEKYNKGLINIKEMQMSV